MVDIALVASNGIMLLVDLGHINGTMSIKALLENFQVRQMQFAVSWLPDFRNKMVTAFQDYLIVLRILK